MKIQITKPSDQEIQTKDIHSWPIWTCDISEFDWKYDQQESCLLLAGSVTVETDHEVVSFGAGDFVVFPKGLQCRWKVSSPVRKHYQFN